MNTLESTQNIELELPADLLEMIDRIANAVGKTRNEVFRAATQEFLFFRKEGDGFLTRNDVCEMLKVSRTSLARLMAREKNPLPHVRYSKTKVRFYEPEIRAWITST
jgi:predicted DNA-binding transcriptional regulator AlpA